MAKQKTHTIDVTEKELRLILTAFDLARDYTLNERAGWWRNTKYVNALYERLRDHGLGLTREKEKQHA